MVQKLFSKLINIDKSILKLMKNILKISLLLSCISCLILSMYINNPISHVTYLAGLKLFKSSLIIAVFGIICGICVDWLKK